jgi:DNA-directed RNA polymerase sigma subunit (sigma70/sigma32)
MADNYFDPNTVAGEWSHLAYNPYRQQAPDARTSMLAQLALAVLTPSEREVIELSFGFRGDPKTDAEVAIIRGSTKRTVKEQRVKALAKMRAALADDDAD